MIPVLRRIIILGLLFGLIFFVQSLKVEVEAFIHPKTLAALGFAILASFTLGELFSFFKLPRVLGYIIIGILFGPYLAESVNTAALKIFNHDILRNLSLVNNVTLGLIAITAGMEMKIEELRVSVKSISLILLFKVVVIFILIPVCVYFLAPFIPFLAGQNLSAILAAGLILSVVALATSIELTFVVANDSAAEGRFIDLILNTAILKDIIVIALLAVVLALVSNMIASDGTIGIEIFFKIGIELIISIGAGALLGLIIIAYLKYIEKEIMIMLLGAVVLGAEISSIFHLDLLIIFITAGFIVQNFYSKNQIVHEPLAKLSLPIFITFFTVAGASINLQVLSGTILIALVITVVRGFAIWLSVSSAAKISREPLDVINYGWMGFFSIGGLIIGVGIIVSEKLQVFGSNVSDIIIALVAINIFLGPIILKIGLSKSKKMEEAQCEVLPPQSDKELTEDQKLKPAVKKAGTLFNEPDFSDDKLNKSLFKVIFQLDSILKDFDRKFILARSEESIELVISATEKYLEEYNRIKKIFSGIGVDPDSFNAELLNTKGAIAGWLAELCTERKEVEKNILKLEPLIKDLFLSLVDITDALQKEYKITLEPRFYQPSETDSLIQRFWKFYLRSKPVFGTFFNKNYKLVRNIPYQKLAKYYLAGESANEILETCNLVGNERLIALRQIKKLYGNVNSYLDDLIKLSVEEKDNIALGSLILEKLEEVHLQIVNELNIYTKEISDTTGEISLRLKYALVNPFNKFLESITTAGSFEGREEKLKYSKIFTQSENAKELALDSIRYWVNYYQGFLGLFKKEALIDKLNFELNSTVQDTLVKVSKEINDNLKKVNLELLSFLSRLKSEFKQSKPGDKEMLMDLFINYRDKYFNQTLRLYINKLELIQRSRRLNLLLENLISLFGGLTSRIPEKVEYLDEKQFYFKDRTPGYVQLKFIELRKIANSILEKKLPREIGELNEFIVNHLNITVNELKSFNSIVGFYLNTALKELESDGDNRQSLFAELVDNLDQKLKYRINELNGQIDRLEKNLITKVRDKVNYASNEIRDITLRMSSPGASLYVEKEKTIKTFSRYLRILSAGTRRGMNRLRINFTKMYRHFLKESIDKILIDLKILSPRVINPDEQKYIDEAKWSKLPFIYRKLFDGTPVESGDLFIKNEELEQRLKSALNNFYENKQASTLIIGEPGAGKNSFINLLRTSILHDQDYIYYSIQQTITTRTDLLAVMSDLVGTNRLKTLEDFILFLNDKENKKVFIIENIGKLFIRQVNGFDALEAFIYLVVSTGENILWICSSGKFVWKFLKSNFSVEPMFKTIIDINDLQKKNIREIVLSRHNATGYGIKYLPENTHQLKSKNLKGSTFENQQKFLSELYFKKLEEFSGGNIISGMYYWMQSICDVKENVIEIKTPGKLELAYISNLDDVYFLSLSALLTQGWLTDLEHSKIFGLPIEKSREILNHLVTLNCLRQDQFEYEANKYFINKFMIKQIENELIKRNMI